jgi:hypothetical protein
VRVVIEVVIFALIFVFEVMTAVIVPAAVIVAMILDRVAPAAAGLGLGEGLGEGEALGLGEGEALALGEGEALGLGLGEGDAVTVMVPKPPSTVAPCLAIMKMFFCASTTNFTSKELPVSLVAVAVKRPPKCSDSPNVPTRFAVTFCPTTVATTKPGFTVPEIVPAGVVVSVKVPLSATVPPPK